jgi:hypothetical protein
MYATKMSEVASKNIKRGVAPFRCETWAGGGTTLSVRVRDDRGTLMLPPFKVGLSALGGRQAMATVVNGIRWNMERRGLTLAPWDLRDCTLD